LYAPVSVLQAWDEAHARGQDPEWISQELFVEPDTEELKRRRNQCHMKVLRRIWPKYFENAEQALRHANEQDTESISSEEESEFEWEPLKHYSNDPNWDIMCHHDLLSKLCPLCELSRWNSSLAHAAVLRSVSKRREFLDTKSCRHKESASWCQHCKEEADLGRYFDVETGRIARFAVAVLPQHAPEDRRCLHHFLEDFCPMCQKGTSSNQPGSTQAQDRVNNEHAIGEEQLRDDVECKHSGAAAKCPTCTLQRNLHQLLAYLTNLKRAATVDDTKCKHGGVAERCSLCILLRNDPEPLRDFTNVERVDSPLEDLMEDPMEESAGNGKQRASSNST
jgi:hypothetical protein